MAFPGTRQSMLFEDSLPGGFNLGMDANAFTNLGMSNLANIQNAGLMGLPGANTTIANQNVADQLQSAYAAVPQGLSIQDLYTKALGREYDPGGLEYWTGRIGPTAEGAEIDEFLRVAQPELSQTKFTPFSGAMLQSGEQQKTVVPGEIVGPGDKEVSDRAWEGTQDLFQTVAEPQQKTVVPTVPAEELAQRIANKEVSDSGQTVAQTAAQTAVDTSNFPKFEGTPYDPKAYENLVKQLTAQQQVLESKGFKYGSTFGGAAETVADMAKRLAAMGISDIRDFGMKHELPVEKVYETIPGDEGGNMTFDTGKYRTISAFKGYDNERNPIFEYRELTPEEVDKLKFDEEGAAFLPIGMSKRSELMNTPYATTKYYNKKTGEEIDTKKFGSKAESGLFASSGAGEGYTNYRVMYNDQGIPVFIPEKELSGMKEFVAKDLPGILSVLRFIPGAQLPVMLAQAASAAYMGVKPEDILKQAATSLIASNVDKFLPAGLERLGVEAPTSELGKLAMKAGASGLASLIQGGDLEDALKSAGMSVAASGIASLLPDLKSGTLDYEKVLRALAPAVARGELTNADVFRLMSSLVTPDKKTPGKP